MHPSPSRSPRLSGRGRAALLALGLLLAGWGVLHASPVLSLRTYLFFIAGPSTAFHAAIEPDDSHTGGEKAWMERENAACYWISTPVRVESGATYEYFLVRRRGFLYFASMSNPHGRLEEAAEAGSAPSAPGVDGNSAAAAAKCSLSLLK